MTLTIDANVVWKPRNILRVVAAKVDDHQEFKILKTVMMRVLTSFPAAMAITKCRCSFPMAPGSWDCRAPKAPFVDSPLSPCY